MWLGPRQLLDEAVALTIQHQPATNQLQKACSQLWLCKEHGLSGRSLDGLVILHCDALGVGEPVRPAACAPVWTISCPSHMPQLPQYVPVAAVRLV
jgi:hypothetical protein